MNPRPTSLYVRRVFFLLPVLRLRLIPLCFWKAFSVCEFGRKIVISYWFLKITSWGVLNPSPTSRWCLSGFLRPGRIFLRFKKTVGCFWKARSFCNFFLLFYLYFLINLRNNKNLIEQQKNWIDFFLGYVLLCFFLSNNFFYNLLIIRKWFRMGYPQIWIRRPSWVFIIWSKINFCFKNHTIKYITRGASSNFNSLILI